MAKPALLAVDDDSEVLRAVERDLRRKYGGAYRVLRADSGTSALETLKQLQLRNESVALLLVDQRMPHLSGVEFLERALKLFPQTKRVLLTAYADTTAAIQAINAVHVDYYLLKPWDPPEQNLYPVLDDLLDDWQASYHPPFEGLRVVGHRWSPYSHAIKDFLGRNQVPYGWMDVEASESNAEGSRLLDAAGVDPSRLPLVLLPDGSILLAPTIEALAERIGLRTHAETSFYDLVIVGAGPAGLAAAVYGASEGLKTVLIEREAPGGQAGMSSRIENYLGFPSGLSGADLARRAVTQARRFGVEILAPQEVIGLEVRGPYRVVTLRDGGEVSCHAVLIATGLSWRTLDVPGLDRLRGAGVYYGAAMTESLACRDQDVYIVGGANSAGQSAMHFSQYARSVTMLVRGQALSQTMSQYLVDQLRAMPNIHVQTCCTVAEALGETRLEALFLLDHETGERRTVPATALFIFIGAVPRTAWLKNVVPLDEHGFVLSGADLIRDGKRPRGWTLDRDPFLLETGVPGVFVAGDTRHGSVKRVASGVGEGSICVQMIHQYLSQVR